MMIAALPLASCIQDEPLNMEADIEAVIFDKDNRDFLLYSSDTIISVRTDKSGEYISVMKKPDSDITNIAPHFKLSDGAKIYYAKLKEEGGHIKYEDTQIDGNGLKLDFTTNHSFKVVSQDGNWSKYYTLSLSVPPPAVQNMEFESFEFLEQNNRTYVNYYEIINGFRHNIWATGNPGYLMSGGKDFPTQRYDKGYSNNGVLLKTVSTGIFGTALKMPIAAGNLFFGTFDTENATIKPLMATRFGIPFNKIPKRLIGKYMFKPGAQMIDSQNNPIYGVTDAPDIYIILYENSYIKDGETLSILLDGNNILTSDFIVGRARLGNNYKISTNDEILSGQWNSFDLEFKLDKGKTIDPVRLSIYGYNLALVFTSSIEGASFKGAIGSELYIDSVELICEE